jgi:hypothetical protein
MLSRDGVTIEWVSIDDWIYFTLTFVTTNDYNCLAALHTPKITVTTTHIKSSHSSLVVAW